MAAPLYTIDLLRLTTETARWPRLADPSASAERRAHPCGSRVAVDLAMVDGRVAAVGLSLAACAFGQASATLMARSVVGRTADELGSAAQAVADWLVGGSVPDWPEIDALAAALPHSARHAAIRLPFEVAAAAARAAGERQAA